MAVCRFDRQVTQPLLLETLRESDPDRQWRAALILSMQDDAESAPVILDGLESPDSWVQWEESVPGTRSGP